MSNSQCYSLNSLNLSFLYHLCTITAIFLILDCQNRPIFFQLWKYLIALMRFLFLLHFSYNRFNLIKGSFSKRVFTCLFASRNRYGEHEKIKIHMFLTGNGGCGKSFLVKCLYEALNKVLSYNGDNSKTKVMLLASTGVATISINRITIYTGLGTQQHLLHLPLNETFFSNIY